MVSPQERIGQLNVKNPNAVRLAETVSIATLIEPQLLRKARLELLGPEVDAGTEADLWFSDLVQFRSAVGIGLRSDVVELLREQLKMNKDLLSKAWNITQTVHKSKSSAIQTEEELVWLELSGQREELQALLRRTVSTLVSRHRKELPHWLARALPRFPETLRRIEEAQMLALGTSLRVELQEELLKGIPRERILEWTGWLTPDVEQVTTYGVRLVEGGIEFGPPSMPKAHKIELSDDQPHIVEVSWEESEETIHKRVRLYSGKQQILEGNVTSFELRLPSGKSYRLSKKWPIKVPRVHITYDVQEGGAIVMKELPFVVGVLADLSGKPEESLPPLKERKFVEIDRDNFNSIFESIRPSLQYKVRNTLKDDEDNFWIGLRFKSIEDFDPEKVISQIEPLRVLLNIRRLMFGLQEKADGNEKLNKILQEIMDDHSRRQEMDKLIREVATTEARRTEERIILSNDFLKKLLSLGNVKKEYNQIAESDTPMFKKIKGFKKQKEQGHESVAFLMEARIIELDSVLSHQLSEIMHAPEFQQVESAWRGLHYLVHQTETGSMLKIRVMNASKKDLINDSQESTEFDQSILFKKVYEDEYGTFGGEPFGALIGDYSFGRDSQEIELLEKISKIAAFSHAPFLAAADPTMFNLDSYTTLPEPRDLAPIFDSMEMTQWNSFRDSEESRYVGLTLPHMLMRLPYGPETVPVETFKFIENVEDGGSKNFLWGNSAHALGTRFTNAFAMYGWCAAFRGVEGGGLVEGLPVHTFKTDEGEIALKCPTEIAITDHRELELSNLGFIPLVHYKGTDQAAFFATQSSHKAKMYDKPEATANARLSAQFQYIFAASRFAQYLKVMTRDKIGSFMTREDCENYLNRWIANYVVLDENAGQELKAKRPLRSAKIDVEEIPDKPGNYKAILFIQPHFQLNELTADLRVEVDLPPPAA